LALPLGQLAERRWARESSPQRPQRPQRDTEGEGNLAVAGTGTGTAGVPPASQPGAAAGRITTSYTYDPSTLQLTKSTATDGTEVHYEYDADGRLAKVTDATGTREFAYDLRGQVTKETVVPLKMRRGQVSYFIWIFLFFLKIHEFPASSIRFVDSALAHKCSCVHPYES